MGRMESEVIMKRQDMIGLILKYWPTCEHFIVLSDLDNLELSELLKEVTPKEADFTNNGYCFI